MESTLPGRPAWATGPLYRFLSDTFPSHRTKLDALDINRLKSDLNMSHEGVYKWLRGNRLTPTAAESICKLANTESNVAALKAVGKSPPKIEDFTRFLFA